MKTPTAVALMARYALATLAEVAGAVLLHARGRARKAPGDVHPALLRVFLPSDRRDG